MDDTLYTIAIIKREIIDDFFPEGKKEWNNYCACQECPRCGELKVKLTNWTAEDVDFSIVSRKGIADFMEIQDLTIEHGERFFDWGDVVGALDEEDVHYPTIGDAYESFFHDPANPEEFLVYCQSRRKKWHRLEATARQDNIPEVEIVSEIWSHADKIVDILDKAGYSPSWIPIGEKNAIKTPSWKIWAV